MPLNIKGHPTDVATANRWALRIENQLDELQKRPIKKVTNTTNTNITQAASGVSDGLVHGDKVWLHDAAYITERDDFISGNIGALIWSTTGASATSRNYSGGFPNLGRQQLWPTTANSSTTVASNCSFLSIVRSATNTSWDVMYPLLDYPGWKLTWVFCFERPYNPKYGGSNSSQPPFDLSKMSSYIGLGADNAQSGSPGFAFIGSGRPSIFFGCRYDTDTTSPAISDTTFHLEACMNPVPSVSTRNNIVGTNGGSFDTGITPVEGRFYRLDMVYTTAGSITMTLSGGGGSSTATFSLTKMSMVYKTNSFAPIISNGITCVNLNAPNTFSTTNGYLPQAPGSILTMSGWGATDTPLNSTFTILQADISSTPTIFTPVGYTTSTGGFQTPTLVGYPALIPFALIANSTQASAPAVNTRALTVDLYDFIWNKGIIDLTSTPDSTQSRY